ncbi:MAG: cobalamin biosynthesis protein CbiL [bacterium]|nr:cobalamin biosynthesis protein CbiL [bacterium]
MARIFALSFLVFSLLCTSSPALAHRVHLFAYVQQGEIVVDSRFSRAKPVQHGKIAVFEAESGKLLLQGISDAQGASRFTIPPELLKKPVDLRLVLKAGEGHQAEWIVPAAELNPQASQIPAEKPAVPSAAAEAETTAPTLAPAAASTVDTSTPIAISAQELEAIINRALDARVQPLQAMLAAEQAKGPGLTEIIGGIGWIIGIFALIFVLKSRKKADEPGV